VYRCVFELPKSLQSIDPASRVELDLGSVRELAEVRVNGRSCGIVWSPPFRVDISDAVRTGENKLEIEVVNFWPNRIVGDAGLPSDQRLTRTNIRAITQDTELMPSGLLGPVTLKTRVECRTGFQPVKRAVGFQPIKLVPHDILGSCQPSEMTP
jgi:hypothetical protein